MHKIKKNKPKGENKKTMKTVYYELKESDKVVGKEISYIKARKWADQKTDRKVEIKLKTVNQDYLRQPR